MCLIIDANVASRVFVRDPDGDWNPILKALQEGRAVAHYGGQLAREYSRIASIRGLVSEFDRAGRIRVHPHADIDRVAEELRHAGTCKSDDQHIIALAQVSKVRLLCSLDHDLHVDFTDPKILKPLGNVYQNATHVRLIGKHCRPTKTKQRRKKRN